MAGWFVPFGGTPPGFDTGECTSSLTLELTLTLICRGSPVTTSVNRHAIRPKVRGTALPATVGMERRLSLAEGLSHASAKWLCRERLMKPAMVP